MDKRVFCRYLCAMVAIVLVIQNLRPQQSPTEQISNLKNGISKPSTLATHPFGMLFYTLPHNFKLEADKVATIDFSLGSGNIWGQPVTTYIPLDSEDRQRLGEVDFFSRTQQFDPENSPSESYSIGYDGIIKDLRLKVSLPLGKKYDLSFAARSFVLTDGRFPFTLLTGDRFIEFFHSNAAGGEDPFGRKFLGLDQAGIEYIDRKGTRLNINNGEFVFSGIEAAFYHYPKWFENSDIAWNFGLHMGANLSKYNRSFDLGFTAGGVKWIYLNNRKQILLGFGAGLLRKKLIEFSENQTDLGASNLFGSFEGHIEYSLGDARNGYHSFGLNYRIQTPYNQKKEEDYYVPFTEERIKRWHEASRHLYKFPSYWTLVYSFTKRTELSIYLQQDMLVNNAPDFQTGIRFKLPIFDQQGDKASLEEPTEVTKQEKQVRVIDGNDKSPRQ